MSEELLLVDDWEGPSKDKSTQKISKEDIRKAKEILDASVPAETATGIVVEGLKMVAEAKEHGQHASIRTDMRPGDSGDDNDYNKDYPHALSHMSARTGKLGVGAGTSYSFYHSTATDELPLAMQGKIEDDSLEVENPNNQSLHTDLSITDESGKSVHVSIDEGRKVSTTTDHDSNKEKTTVRPATARTHKAALRLMKYKLRKQRGSKS